MDVFSASIIKVKLSLQIETFIVSEVVLCIPNVIFDVVLCVPEFLLCFIAFFILTEHILPFYGIALTYILCGHQP